MITFHLDSFTQTHTLTDKSASVLSNTAELMEAETMTLSIHFNFPHPSFARIIHCLYPYTTPIYFFLHFRSNYMPLCIEFKLSLNIQCKLSFLCGISHTKSEAAIFFYLFLYLFICPLIEVLVTWFLVWVCRREKTGFQYTVCHLCFVGGHIVYLV